MANDIAGYLYGIKENIRAVEDGCRDKQLFDEIEADTLTLLELMKLFLISERDSYYGYFMMNLSFCVDFSNRSIAGIALNTFPPEFCTNPLLLCKFSLKEILFIVCHEIDHIVLNHPAEMVRLNPQKDEETYKRFNFAADASVNDRLNLEIKSQGKGFMTAPEGHISSLSLKRMFKLRQLAELESYMYYFKKIQGKALPPQQQPERMMAAVNEGASSGEAESDSVITARNCGEMTDHNWDAGEDEEEAAAAVRELVNSAVALMNDEVRGQMPGFFTQQVKQLNMPARLSWQAILKKYVGTIATGKRKTRTRLNHRQPERFDLSGRKEEKVLKIVVAIDTSASVSDKDVAQIFREIFAMIARRRHAVTVIECDSQVQRVYLVKTPKDVKKSVAGRGGTAFTPVIEYLNENRYYRDALLIYFTDGYGERSIPRPKTYRNLWVVLENEKHLSIQEPYGAVVAF